MKARKTSRAPLALFAALLTTWLSLALPAQEAPPPAWEPPAPRDAKTPFAPRPSAGNNIFKGEAEAWLAQTVADSLEPFKDRQVTDYVARLGRHLAAHSASPSKRYEFVVLDDPEANAMNAGGGLVYVNLGMLREVESEDELAGIIAHELAHDAFGHAPKTVTRQLFWMTGVKKVTTREEVRAALEKLFAEYEKKPFAAIAENLFGFSRFDELEADRAAFYNTYKAGYNPRALTAALRRMERAVKEGMGKDEYRRAQFLTLLFGSHPPTSQRATALAWESNFFKMPKKDERRASPAFDAMKARVRE